ncbi:uncharacterized protein LOC100375629 [Saccoglossus kowalevskii]|uniref:Uncharacterized protein LOC100375629 n=1 Tax=Saccoglossus kowalevskii TaxID=10224 RepID=A0ABM0GTG9_SACKO|nr:PREDICTED: uncharacterized protein LOC100375629 [Saccoglossus kowalevskii]
MLLTSVYWTSPVSIVLYIQLITSALSLSSSPCNGNDSESMYKITTINGEANCVPCSKCPAGFGVVTECQGEQDTQCEICAEGTYSAATSQTSPCKPCTTCSFHLTTTRNCTRTRNAECAKKCDYAYFKNALTGECSPCSWCFQNKPEMAPPVIQECVDQGMPRNFQCMPSANRDDVPTYKEYKNHLERIYQFAAKNLATDFLKQDNVTAIPSSTSIPSHHHVTIPIVVTSGIVVLICLIILMIILIQRCNKRQSHRYENIDERFDETDDVEGRHKNGYCNLVEQHEYYKYIPAEEDTVGSTAVQYGKETDSRRCVELNTATEKTRIV